MTTSLIQCPETLGRSWVNSSENIDMLCFYCTQQQAVLNSPTRVSERGYTSEHKTITALHIK